VHSLFNAPYWAVSLVDQMWEFILAMWKNRNSEVHGEMTEEQASIIMAELQAKVRSYYEKFTSDPSFLLYSGTTAFSLPKASYDHLTCWLRSVDEAISTKQFQDQNTKRFF